VVRPGERDYREELDAHLEMEVRENLDRGMSPQEAREAALRTFGNVLAVRQHPPSSAKLAEEVTRVQLTSAS